MASPSCWARRGGRLIRPIGGRIRFCTRGRRAARRASGASTTSPPEPGGPAKTSAGGSCQTPCTLEVPTGGGFSVTFAREGFAPQTVAVQVQPDQEKASVKFTPNPVFAQLGPAPGAKKKPAAKRAAKPATAAPGTSGR